MSRSQKFVAAVASQATRLVGGLDLSAQVFVVGDASFTWETRRKAVAKALVENKEIFCVAENRTLSARKAEKIFCIKELVIWPTDQGSGGYRPLFDDLMVGCTISKIAIPGDLKKGCEQSYFYAGVAELMKSMAKGRVVFARIDGEHITMIRDKKENAGEWMEFLKPTGIRLQLAPGAEKVDKRSAFLTNLYPMTLEAEPDQLKLTVIRDARRKVSMDGMFVMGKKIAHELIGTIDVPIREQDIESFGEAGAKRLAQWRKSRMVERALKAKIWHARIVVPGHGLLKGHVVISDNVGENEIVTHACNIKDEVTGSKRWYLACDPMPAKSESRTSVQSMLAFPKLFGTTAQCEWASAYAEWVKEEVKAGKPLDTFDSLLEVCKDVDGGLLSIDSEVLQRRWTAVYAVELGLDFRHMPSLVPDLTVAHLVSMRSPEHERKKKVNIPIPAACEWQVVSQTIANLAGSKVIAKDGEVRMDEEFEFAVVSNRTWKKMVPVHGGCDLDDKFVMVFCKFRGKELVFVFRNPCDRGEYSILKRRKGDWHPGSEWWKAVPFFPEVDLRGECPRTGKEPPELDKGAGRTHGAYTGASFVEGLKRALGGANPGSIINAKMLWNSTHLFQQMEDLPFTMEQVVDTCVQGGNPELIDQMQQWAKKVVAGVVMENVPIDENFWVGRGFDRAIPADVEVNLKPGWLTKIYTHVQRVIKQTWAEMDDWAQRIHETPVEIVARASSLTKDEGKSLVAIFKRYRVEAAMAIERGEKDKEWWNNLVQETKDSVVNLDPEQQVVELFAKFALVVHTTPNAKGRINDKILLHRKFLPHYFEVMQEMNG